jgi:hypothetical protein
MNWIPWQSNSKKFRVKWKWRRASLKDLRFPCQSRPIWTKKKTCILCAFWWTSSIFVTTLRYCRCLIERINLYVCFVRSEYAYNGDSFPAVYLSDSYRCDVLSCKSGIFKRFSLEECSWIPFSRRLSRYGPLGSICRTPSPSPYVRTDRIVQMSLRFEGLLLSCNPPHTWVTSQRDGTVLARVVSRWRSAVSRRSSYRLSASLRICLSRLKIVFVNLSSVYQSTYPSIDLPVHLSRLFSNVCISLRARLSTCCIVWVWNTGLRCLRTFCLREENPKLKKTSDLQ